MNNDNKSIVQIVANAALIILITILIPLAMLGFYNHPLGDDFHYGSYAKAALESGGFFDAIKAAAAGTANQYQIWQGTYSAMFLMYLPPQIFGDFMYKLYPTLLLSLLTFSVFYLFKPIVTFRLKGSKGVWLIVSSVIVFLFTQQVPLMGETFYWYNGSMYYTGFFAITLIFFGGVYRFTNDLKNRRIVTLSLVALFIAGGNYVSLLPTVIIMFFILALIICKKKSKKEILGISIILFFLLTGFVISILAPGNSMRADTAYGLSPVKSILKSILQALGYLRGWSNVWLFVATIGLTPLFIKLTAIAKFEFRHPVLIIGFAFGVFASASCPTFYGQGNGGAARAFDLSWYMMVLFVFFSYFYALGWYIGKINKKSNLVGMLTLLAVFIILIPIRSLSETYIELNSLRAATAIINGEAQYYEDQYQKRLEILASDATDIVFEPYDVPESLMYVLYLGDITEDPDFMTNQNFATYYKKNSVRLSNK